MKIPNSHFGYISVSQLEDDNYLVQEILSAENNPGSEHQSSETINSVAHDEASNVVKEGQLRLVNGRVENEVCLLILSLLAWLKKPQSNITDG